MLTAVVFLLSAALIVVVGESVRGQLKRMVSRPAVALVPDQLGDTASAAPAVSAPAQAAA